MKQIILAALLLHFVNLSAQKDPEAEPYLNKVAKELAPGHALFIEFDYERNDLQSDTRLEGNGSLVLMDEKYRVEIDEAVIFFDGVKQYSLNKEIEEVYVSIPDPNDKEFMFSDPIRLLAKYNEAFKYQFIGDAVIEGISTKEVQLYPEELGGPYALIKLFFSPVSSELKAIVIRHKEGIVYTMLVTEMGKKENPAEDFFRFNQKDFPNVDMIELVQ